MFISLTFGAPWFLLTLLVPLAAAIRQMTVRRRVPGFVAPCADLFEVPSTLRQRLRLVPLALRCVALALLCVALAEPRLEIGVKRAAPRDVAILMDVSGSMLAEDAVPNRLGAAKAFANRLVAQSPSDRFAVVTFGGEAITDCPLTADHDAVRDALQAADYRQEEEGTALGRGLAAAIRTLRTGSARQKGIVLLSDGAENAGELLPSTAASFAVPYGIIIDAIGIGSSGRPVTYPTPFGSLEVRLDLDEPALRSLAAAGGGLYWRDGDPTAIAAIDQQLGRTAAAAQDSRQPDAPSVGWVCALVAVFCLVAEAVLGSRVLRLYA